MSFSSSSVVCFEKFCSSIRWNISFIWNCVWFVTLSFFYNPPPLISAM
jgi:hypothetical protein